MDEKEGGANDTFDRGAHMGYTPPPPSAWSNLKSVRVEHSPCAPTLSYAPDLRCTRYCMDGRLIIVEPKILLESLVFAVKRVSDADPSDRA